MLMELVNTQVIIVVIGSFLGSLKANFNDREKKPKFLRCTNVIIGIFCGISTGLHYEVQLNVGLVGLSCVLVSMLAVSILDTLYILTPVITKTLLELRLGIKK